jgi:glycopeptide antibiotics resistance protein
VRRRDCEDHLVLLRRPVLTLLAVPYLGTLAVLTLTPSASGDRAFSLLGRLVAIIQGYERTDWVGYSLVEFVANTVVFLPLGLLVVLLIGRRHWLVAIAAGLLASCWIELAQGIWIGDRVADARDIASNTIGTALGVAIALLVTWPAAHRDRRIAEAGTASHARA